MIYKKPSKIRLSHSGAHEHMTYAIAIQLHNFVPITKYQRNISHILDLSWIEYTLSADHIVQLYSYFRASNDIQVMQEINDIQCHMLVRFPTKREM